MDVVAGSSDLAFTWQEQLVLACQWAPSVQRHRDYLGRCGLAGWWLPAALCLGNDCMTERMSGR
jgi:hypothetical protein